MHISLKIFQSSCLLQCRGPAQQKGSQVPGLKSMPLAGQHHQTALPRDMLTGMGPPGSRPDTAHSQPIAALPLPALVMKIAGTSPESTGGKADAGIMVGLQILSENLTDEGIGAAIRTAIIHGPEMSGPGTGIVIGSGLRMHMLHSAAGTGTEHMSEHLRAVMVELLADPCAGLALSRLAIMQRGKGSVDTEMQMLALKRKTATQRLAQSAAQRKVREPSSELITTSLHRLMHAAHVQ